MILKMTKLGVLNVSASFLSISILLGAASLNAQTEDGRPPKSESTKTIAPKNCKKRRGRFHFQFEEAKIVDVLKQISYLTCKNFILSESLKGGSKQITIISRKPVTVDQAYSAFLSALEANNMALINAGKYNKLVERKGAVKEVLPVYEKKGDGTYGRIAQGDHISYRDAYVTLLYELKHASKEQVDPLVKNMLSRNADIQALPNGTLVLTDSAANIRRLIAILERVDIAGSSSRVHVVDVLYGEATQIQQKLDEIFKDVSIRTDAEEGKPAENVTIEKMIADERTNKLIVISSPAAFKRIREMIDILDIPSDVTSSGSQVFVYKLNNANAEEVSQTLSSLAQGSRSNSSSRNNKKGKKANTKDPAQLFEGEVKVTADKSTNSLVIVASARDYRSLTPVIENLDRRRKQVFVEATILELNISKSRSIGVDAYMPIPGLEIPGVGDITAIAANAGGQGLITSSATLASVQNAASSVTANLGGADALALGTGAVSSLENMLGWLTVVGPSIPTPFGFQIPSLGAVINALETTGHVDILSTPHLLTMDNEEAEISIGQEVPILSGFGNGGGGGALGGFGGAFGNRVEFKDVKLKFKVTPHVSNNDEVRIEIEQEVSSLGEETDFGNGIKQPSVNTRDLRTTVRIGDQRTAVIGGLIGSRKTESERRFPVLADIPVLGWLFKTWGDSEQKTNLILVLTPYIVDSEDDFKDIYERRMKERRDFVDAYFGAAHKYNPYINYKKKSGPGALIVDRVNMEMMKIENGGPGLPGEILVTPDAADANILQGLEPLNTESAKAEGIDLQDSLRHGSAEIEKTSLLNWEDISSKRVNPRDQGGAIAKDELEFYQGQDS